MMFSKKLYLDKFMIGSSLVLLLFYLISCDPGGSSQQYEWQGRTMGTTWQVKVTQTQINESAFTEIGSHIDSLLKNVNAQMSTYDPESEISKFNNFGSTEPFTVSKPFYEVLTASLKIYQKSGGAFDITVAPLVNMWGFGPKESGETIPDDGEITDALKKIGSDKIVLVGENQIRKTIPDLQLDMSAIAKGYGVNAVAQLLESYNFLNYMVEIGGEVKVAGINASGDPWKIGIDHPEHASLPGEQLEGILSLKDVAVATSGDYRNYFIRDGQHFSHTIDPKTGKPVTHNLASVTILASSCMLADGLATAAMVLGPEKGLKWIEEWPGVEAMLIIREDEQKFTVKYTTGFKDHLLSNENNSF
jgi:thiamine biosynthesis lipoprotein